MEAEDAEKPERSRWWKLLHPGRLQQKGVLGMNRRNVDYIGRYNPRRLFPLVDDKLKTKRLALDADVRVPELLGVIGRQYDVRKLGNLVQSSPGFCIKPAKGAGGKGILVIARQQNGIFYKPSGQSLTLSEVERHVSNILAGLFSLGGVSDAALIEDLIQTDQVFDGYTFEGVPDTRVIVFRGFPGYAQAPSSHHGGRQNRGQDPATHCVRHHRRCVQPRYRAHQTTGLFRIF